MWNIRSRKNNSKNAPGERKNLKKSNGGSKICECGAVFAQNYKESGSKSRADVLY